jgi:uncharacterized repeat protein (TIGR03803 family)
VVFAPTATSAQTFTTLVSFDVSNDEEPYAMTLVQGLDGNLYGTTSGQGLTGASTTPGTVFKITPAGTLTTLYRFCSQPNCADGERPFAGLALGTDGSFYGVTSGGGAGTACPHPGCGTVFKITPAGKLTTLYSFCSQPNCADGEAPFGALVQATDGNFYGTTEGGGAKQTGTVFKITTNGSLTTLYSFCQQTNCADGEYPLGALIQATDGNLYGITWQGGNSERSGTFFKITTTGTFTSLREFNFSRNPEAGVIQATDGNFYGTSYQGGNGASCPHNLTGCGTVFKITSKGVSTALYRFCSQTNCADGQYPYAPLVQGTDGNFYGTTYYGGSQNDGTVFEITSTGTLTTLHSFDASGSDGSIPVSGLVQHTDGDFYGTTLNGGTSKVGTVYKLSMGLGLFVKTLPTAAKAGTVVRILGTDLTGATSVQFNGTAATFTVVSATQIKTTVPAGATTGTVTVTTPSGTLTSNVAFRVLP